MATTNDQALMLDPRIREAGVTIPVYGQLPFVPERASGCDIFTRMAGASSISTGATRSPHSAMVTHDWSRP